MNNLENKINLTELLSKVVYRNISEVETPEICISTDYALTASTILGPKNTIKLIADKNDEVPLNYLSNLSKIVGPKKATEIAIKYTIEQLINMEEKYDKFNFDTQPKVPKEKLKRILKFIEWEEKFRDVTEMNYHMESITESFSVFETFVRQLIDSNNRSVRLYSFIEDGIYGVTRNLIKTYGVKPTRENKKTGHLAREEYDKDKKVIPGITTFELIDLLIEKRMEDNPVDKYAIISGFDDARTALEVATMTKGYNNMVHLYVAAGFTSLEQVKSISLDKLIKLSTSFNFRGNLNSKKFHLKNLNRLVLQNIHGKVEKIDDLLEIANNNGQNYLVVFDGSIDKTKRILKIDSEERPSLESIEYTRNVLKVFDFKKTIEVAKEIDSEHKKIFKQNFETKEEFLEFKQDYEATFKDFVEKTDTSLNFSYKTVKNFDGDLRFLVEFNDDLKLIEKIKSVMDYETYHNLNVSWKGSLIPELIDANYSAEEIKTAFSGETQIDGYKLKQNFRKLKDTYSLQEMTDIFKDIDNIESSYAISMMQEVSFKEKGIPYKTLHSLKANDITSEQFKNFVELMGVEQYKQPENDKTKPLFNVVGMVEDLKVFYNKNTKKK